MLSTAQCLIVKGCIQLNEYAVHTKGTTVTVIFWRTSVNYGLQRWLVLYRGQGFHISQSSQKISDNKGQNVRKLNEFLYTDREQQMLTMVYKDGWYGRGDRDFTQSSQRSHSLCHSGGASGGDSGVFSCGGCGSLRLCLRL